MPVQKYRILFYGMMDVNDKEFLGQLSFVTDRLKARTKATIPEDGLFPFFMLSFQVFFSFQSLFISGHCYVLTSFFVFRLYKKE